MVSFKRPLSPFLRVYSHDLIISQGPHFLILYLGGKDFNMSLGCGGEAETLSL